MKYATAAVMFMINAALLALLDEVADENYIHYGWILRGLVFAMIVANGTSFCLAMMKLTGLKVVQGEFEG